MSVETDRSCEQAVLLRRVCHKADGLRRLAQVLADITENPLHLPPDEEPSDQKLTLPVGISSSQGQTPGQDEADQQTEYPAATVDHPAAHAGAEVANG